MLISSTVSVDVLVSSSKARRIRGFVSISKVSPCEMTSWLDGSNNSGMFINSRNQQTTEPTFHIESEPNDSRIERWFHEIHHTRQLTIGRYAAF